MILVDTSVWIDFFRGKDLKLIHALQNLLDEDQVALAAPVRIEILSGSQKSKIETLRRVLAALPTFYPTPVTWATLEDWIDQALNKGDQFGAFDLLIGSLSKEHNTQLWSLDKDFQRMERLGWVRLYNPS